MRLKNKHRLGGFETKRERPRKRKENSKSYRVTSSPFPHSAEQQDVNEVNNAHQVTVYNPHKHPWWIFEIFTWVTYRTSSKQCKARPLTILTLLSLEEHNCLKPSNAQGERKRNPSNRCHLLLCLPGFSFTMDPENKNQTAARKMRKAFQVLRGEEGLALHFRDVNS